MSGAWLRRSSWLCVAGGVDPLSAWGYRGGRRGHETHCTGFEMGPSYVFDIENSPIHPFIGCEVGLGWVDSHSTGIDSDGMGQNFNFTFSVEPLVM